MKNGKLHNKLNGQVRLLIMLAALTAFVAGCTKSRTPEIADEELQKRIFAIKELQNKNFEIETGEAVQSQVKQGPSVEAEKPKAKIKKATVPTRLQGIFAQTAVQANAGETYPVRFTVNKKYVNVFKVVSSDTELTMLERKLAQKEAGKLVVPLFKIPVARYGVIKKIKNENKEETSNLTLFETDWANATHIEIPIRYDDIQKIGEDTNNLKELEEIYLSDRLDKQVTTLADLKEQLKVSIAPADATKVYTLIDPSRGGDGRLQIYTITSVGQITDEKILQKLKTGQGLGVVEYCPAEVLSQISVEEQKDCVILLNHSVALEHVNPSLSKEDGDGTLSSSIEFEKSEGAKNSGLIRIAKNSVVESVNVLVLGQINPYNTIRVEDIKGKEFLMRRTFEDGASSIMVFGPGASGNMDIVAFELEDDRLVVRRQTAVNGDNNPGRLDKEELLSIPAVYFKRDTDGNTVAVRLVETSKEQAEFITVDWTRNSIPSLNSPLSYFDAGQCFIAVGAESISDLDNRISQGTLNFSISGSYSFRPECMSWYNMSDYWYGAGLQSNFNLKERVSFKLHTKELDNKGIDLPFRAQNLLGFGVFTAGEITQDAFGNGGNTVDTLKAHPVIHDFSDGKQLVYTLGGLPKSGWMREALISGTKEVVEDWNKSLKQAFAGTSLDRKEPYIVLLIDGVDAPAGRLGDLDKNYIWNFEKNLDSGLLGMSQAAPNPRSGRIEQNNVLMYSGNLLSQVGSAQMIARMQREHRAMKQAALEAAEQEEKEAEEAEQQGNVVGQAQTKEGAAELVGKLVTRAMVNRPVTPTLAKSDIAKANIASLKAKASAVPRNKNESVARAQNALAQMNETAYLKRIYEKAIAMDATRDELMLNSLSAAEVLRAYGNRLSPEQRKTLAAQSRTLALKAEFNRSFAKGPNCAITARTGLVAGDNSDLRPKEELFKEWYKSTLAHEIGHSLGLTHNFQGSVDKANFLFAGEKAGDDARNYSSVMDYIPDQLQVYKGPGPYDVHALRAAYTGLIELHPQVAASAKVDKADGKKYVYLKDRSGAAGKEKVEVVGRGEIRLEDLKRVVLGDESWWKLDATFYNQVPIKPYAYCTDVHVGGDPSCNRWDMGTNDLEIAQFYANEYKDLYPVLNSLGNRVNARSLDAYIGRLFYQFFGLRPFMDETFYKLISGWPVEYVMPTAYAGLTGLNTFAEIIATPNINAQYDDPARFSVIKVAVPKVNQKGEVVVGEDGKPVIDRIEKVVVEAKPIQDLYVPGHSDLVQTRGNEFDKALAIMMLTERGMGHPRYESIGLRVSYADFENLFGIEASQSMTLRTLAELISDNPVAKVNTPIGLQGLDPVYQPQTTDIVRYYGILGASMLLDADTTEDRYNFASLFRIGSSMKTKPKGRFVVTKLDYNLNSDTALKLWAYDNATFGSDIVRSAAQKRALLENAPRLTQQLLLALKGEMEQKPEDTKKAMDQVTKILETLNKEGVLVSSDEALEGISTEMHAAAALSFMKQNMAIVAQVVELVQSGQIPVELLPMLLGDIGIGIETQAKSLAIIGIAEKALLAGFGEQTVKGQVFRMYLSDQHLESNHGVVVSNLQFMNKILTIMYPEMNRLQ